uniref:Ovule protein n=1 Tax=Heterorhabditis bacteriophora TaxID=37862 RepID=A0A1I7WWE8_HETBA
MGSGYSSKCLLQMGSSCVSNMFRTRDSSTYDRMVYFRRHSPSADFSPSSTPKVFFSPTINKQMEKEENE